ncbi:DUF3108 domain-containing protein [Pseudohalioglobus lutimaris]|uniref:DUF3108 domain-containing protein n=2 Tax=Pseudohalioglobus lutimaris TaxID=1737061 RepID=A0A2N5WWY2_9GAMM|nr:DUF3108 domain-containing protein [Pseudohalioglobus lutimaris]
MAVASLPGGAANATSEQEATELSPYTAKYRTTARGMALTLNRKLERNADNSYTLTNGGKIMVVGFHEMSVFSTRGTSIIPKSYVYQGTGLINRRREIHFTQGADTIRSLYKDQWYDLPYEDGTLDRFSQQEQLRLFLLNDPDPREDISIRVADGKRVKEYLLRYMGEAVLDTPMGQLQTLHFKRIHDDPDRTSDTWIAPELDYLMVKTVHVEDGSTTTVMITEAKLQGR